MIELFSHWAKKKNHKINFHFNKFIFKWKIVMKLSKKVSALEGSSQRPPPHRKPEGSVVNTHSFQEECSLISKLLREIWGWITKKLDQPYCFECHYQILMETLQMSEFTGSKYLAARNNFFHPNWTKIGKARLSELMFFYILNESYDL